MAFEVKFNVTAEYDMPDVLSIHFATDAPVDALVDGSEVVQWAQFRLTSDVNGEYQKVACRSIVGGDFSGVTIDTYFGYSGFLENDVAGQTLDAVQADEKVPSSMAEAYTYAADEYEYMNYDSAISGNKFIGCTAVLNVSKMDRDYTMFGEYDVIMGTRVYTDATTDTAPISLGEFETKYFLEEPEYTDGDSTTSDEDLMYVELDYKTWDINVSEDLGFNGRGTQNVYTELIASPYFYDDDVLRIIMDLDLPDIALEDGTVVYQYIQLIGKDETEGTDPYISVGCQLTVGEEGSQKVENFYGLNKMDYATAGENKSVDEQNNEEKIDAEYGSFVLSDEEWWYSTWETGNGNKVSTCVVDMPIEKGEGRDEDIFKAYIATKGARLYSSLTDNQPYQIGEKKTEINLGEANYDADTYVDPEVAALFEADSDAAFEEGYVETEITLQGT